MLQIFDVKQIKFDVLLPDSNRSVYTGFKLVIYD